MGRKSATKAAPASPSASTCSADQLSSRSSSDTEPAEAKPKPGTPPAAAVQKRDKNLWYIHGHEYDLSEFVEKHPGGRLAILSGRGRDCTALFESYHPWNDRHRRVLKAYGPAPPPVDPFYEEIKQKVREAYPGGSKETKMRPTTFAALLGYWSIMIYLFFFVQTLWACAIAGCIMATVGTRLAHEGGHYQVSSKEWVNRLALFLGYFPTGPSMTWHYRHVISHHAHTNQAGDVDVEYIWIADMLPGWLKILALPGVAAGSVVEIGPKSLIDLFIFRSIGGHHVDWTLGGLLIEAPIWILVHWFAGPSWLGYLVFWFFAGAFFLPCSQVAHAILYPDSRTFDSWAKMQIAESCDFAADSSFWYHVAFGLTTQVEHHLFPGIGHHCYERIRHITRGVCAKHGVKHYDVSASQAFGALWARWVTGHAVPLA